MGVIKLEAAGAGVEFITREIRDDVSKERGKHPQWRFEGRTPDDPNAVIWLFTSTAERQLARIGLTRESIIGKVVVFSRTKDNYIDVNLRAEPWPAAGASSTTSAEPLTDEQKKSIIGTEKALLSYCLGCAHKKLLPEYLSGHDLDVSTISEDAWIQGVTTLGAALYQGLSARGVTR